MELGRCEIVEDNGSIGGEIPGLQGVPHFNVVSAGGEAIFAIDDLAVLAGALPVR